MTWRYSKYSPLIIAIVRGTLIYALAAFLALLALSAVSRAEHPSIATYRQYIVQIETPTSYGSGVILHNGTVLTAKHVVDGAGMVVITTYGGRMVVSNKIWVSGDTDIAILEVSLGTGLPMACREPVWGEHITVIGFPMGLQWALSAGVVAMTTPDPDNGAYPINVAVSPGSSGGPVLDTGGKIIGIVTKLLANRYGPSGLAGMIPSSVICGKIPA